jgi:hypothetical protein
MTGIDSRRAPLVWGGNPGPNGFPLFRRFSAARSTSVRLCQSAVSCSSQWHSRQPADPHCDVPSNCEAKAFTSWMFPAGLEPRSMLLGVPAPL